jgi:hypothetical protein
MARRHRPDTESGLRAKSASTPLKNDRGCCTRLEMEAYFSACNAPAKERQPMAIHLTPTELAREAGLERRDVIAKCIQLGVPIFNGRIDKTLFLSSLRETSSSSRQPQAARA